MEAFLEEKEVLSVKEQFFVQEGQPWWGVLVSYRDEPPNKRKYGVGYPANQRKNERGREGTTNERKDWRGTLQTEEERGWFDLLRRWRSDRAHLEGAPPYTILTDRQVVELLQKKPETLESLGEIEGIGEARLKRFGKELLEVLSFRKDGRLSEAWEAWAKAKNAAVGAHHDEEVGGVGSGAKPEARETK